jgi:protein TonB
MKTDQIVGILIALLFHAGLAFGNRLLPASAAPAAAPAADDIPTIAVAPMPVLEPEPPDPLDTLSSDDAEPVDLSDLAPPPMQADIPVLATSPVFQQKLQPPPPPNLGGPATAITIPTGNFAAAGSGLKGLLVDLAALDQRPSPRFKVNPDFPYEMSRSHQRGEVVLGFIVDLEGNVRDPYIISSTNPAFEAPALRAISRWKFTPGKKGGVAVNTRNVHLPIDFGRTQ